jgi:hypothetical protein
MKKIHGSYDIDYMNKTSLLGVSMFLKSSNFNANSDQQKSPNNQSNEINKRKPLNTPIAYCTIILLILFEAW